MRKWLLILVALPALAQIQPPPGGGGSGGTSSNFGSAFPGVGTAAGFKDSNGNMAAGLLDMSGNLLVNVASFTGTVTVTGTVTANQGAANATPWNENLADVGGAPFALGQQVAGASLPIVLTAAQLATLTPLATVTVNQGTNPWTVNGTVTANQGGAPWSVSQSGSPWGVNLADVGGAAFSLGQQLAAGSLPVVLTAAQLAALTPLATVAVTQSTNPWTVNGTVTANQGGAPWSVSQSGAPWSVSQSGSPWGVSVTNSPTVNQGGAPWSVSQSGAPWSVSETYSNVPQGEMLAPLPIYGPQSNGVPAQNTVEIAGVYSPNPPTVQKGQATRLQTDGSGNLLAKIMLPLPPSPANIQDASGLRPVYGPCLYLARQTYVINNLSSNTLAITGSAGKNIAVCDYYISPCAAACNVALVEGTSGACTSGASGLQGGATAATGANLAINGGFVQAANPNGDPWGITKTPGDSVCVFPSAAVNGVINYVGPF